MRQNSDPFFSSRYEQAASSPIEAQRMVGESPVVRRIQAYIGKLEGFSPEALARLLTYDWPGNSRELKNLLEAIFVTPPAGRIGLEDLPKPFCRRFRAGELGYQDKRDLLLAVLLSANWNKSRAAQKLRWSRMTLYRKMMKYDLAN
jgi:transcriptional regulator of acetoin/glycerol metabolism